MFAVWLCFPCPQWGFQKLKKDSEKTCLTAF